MPRKPHPSNPPTHWTLLLSKPHPDLSALPSRTKARLLRTIAHDISAAFIRISKLLDTDVLSSRHTGPIEDVVGLIAGVEKEHRRVLERRVRRAERRERRRVRRWRGERRWMRRSFAELLGKATEVSGRWRERVRYFKEKKKEGMGMGIGRGLS